MRAWKDKNYPETVLISEWANPVQAIPAGFNIDFMIHFGIKGYPSLFFDRKTPWGQWEQTYKYCYFDKAGKGSLKEFYDNFSKSYNATKELGYIALPSANHDYQRPNIGTRNTFEQLKVAPSSGKAELVLQSGKVTYKNGKKTDTVKASGISAAIFRINK